MQSQSIENIRRSLRRLNQSYGVFDDKTWEEFGITYALSQVLFAIAESPAPIAKQISETLQIEKSTTSRFLLKLREERLISFKASSEDARLKLLCLTEKGHAMIRRLNQFGDEKTSRALKGLSLQEMGEIENALLKLEVRLRGNRCL